jgi:hypothetical protein
MINAMNANITKITNTYTTISFQKIWQYLASCGSVRLRLSLYECVVSLTPFVWYSMIQHDTTQIIKRFSSTPTLLFFQTKKDSGSFFTWSVPPSRRITKTSMSVPGGPRSSSATYGAGAL